MLLEIATYSFAVGGFGDSSGTETALYSAVRTTAECEPMPIIGVCDMCGTQILSPSLVAGFLAVLLWSNTASAQQLSPPEVVQLAKEVSLKSNSPEAIFVNCPEGTKVVGGGGGTDPFAGANFAMVWSSPITGQQADGWSVGMVNRSLTTKKGHIFVYALCSKVK